MPTRYKLSGDLLNHWHQRIIAENSLLLNVCESLTLLSDDSGHALAGNHTIHFLLATPQPIFLKSVHPGSTNHSGEFIASQFKSIIEDEENLSGKTPRDYFACCTDHASNMLSAWKIIQEKFPWIQCYG